MSEFAVRAGRRQRTWLKGVLIAVALVAIALQWVNTRVAILKVNQNPSNPVVLATYPIYHSMATGMREGRVGQVDLLAVRDYSLLNDLSAPFVRRPANAEHQWVNFYTLDVGYSFIVEVARLAFPTLPDNHLRALALQLVFDLALVWFVFFLFSQWHLVLGFLAAALPGHEALQARGRWTVGKDVDDPAGGHQHGKCAEGEDR